MPANTVLIMNDVGLAVGLLSHPGTVVPCSARYRRICRSINRQIMSAMISIIPNASIRDGVFKNRSLTTSGSLRKEKSLSMPYFVNRIWHYIP